MSAWTLRLVLTAAVVALLVEGSAAGGSASGWIESFDGETEQYLIMRGGERVAAQIFMPLLEGDQIVVKTSAGRLRIALGDGSSTTDLHPGTAPYIVGPARVPTLPTNMMRWAAGMFTPWNRARQSAVVGVHVRSGGPILLPPFEGTFGRLQAGTRPLFLGWQGGKAPYRVSLERAGPLCQYE